MFGEYDAGSLGSQATSEAKLTSTEVGDVMWQQEFTMRQQHLAVMVYMAGLANAAVGEWRMVLFEVFTKN
jgi:hypothetical protein